MDASALTHFSAPWDQKYKPSNIAAYLRKEEIIRVKHTDPFLS